MIAQCAESVAVRGGIPGFTDREERILRSLYASRVRLARSGADPRWVEYARELDAQIARFEANPEFIETELTPIAQMVFAREFPDFFSGQLMTLAD